MLAFAVGGTQTFFVVSEVAVMGEPWCTVFRFDIGIDTKLTEHIGKEPLNKVQLLSHLYALHIYF